MQGLPLAGPNLTLAVGYYFLCMGEETALSVEKLVGNPYENSFVSNISFALSCIGNALIHEENGQKERTLISLSLLLFLSASFCPFSRDFGQIYILNCKCTYHMSEFELYFALSKGAVNCIAMKM